MVHVVLAIISLAMGTAIGWLGWKGLRALRSGESQVSAAEKAPARQGKGI